MVMTVDIGRACAGVTQALKRAGWTELPFTDDMRPEYDDELVLRWAGSGPPGVPLADLLARTQLGLLRARLPRNAKPIPLNDTWMGSDTSGYALNMYVGEDDLTAPEQPPMLDIFLIVDPHYFGEHAPLVRALAVFGGVHDD